MSNAIVLMTALVPTLGHKYLIDFAKNLVSYDGTVHVIVGTLSKEPVDGTERFYALKSAFASDRNVYIHHLHRDVPQTPSEHPKFWEVWRDIVKEFVDVKENDYVVASELYGIDMANILGCNFMPCNRYRETLPISGTEVRNDLLKNFVYILPEFQHNIRRTVTIFGAESCGKTTMARWLSSELNGHFIPEWAREYLETEGIGTEVTPEKMRAIVSGQYALQCTAYGNLFNKPFIFQDTDLYSTLGYYRLWGGGSDEDLNHTRRMAMNKRSDLYIVMNDKIPFEADILRYGGNKRESKTQFWVDLLEEFGQKYHIVESTNLEDQRAEVASVVLSDFNKATVHIKEYQR